MSTQSDFLELTVWTRADKMKVEEINENFKKIEDYLQSLATQTTNEAE